MALATVCTDVTLFRSMVGYYITAVSAAFFLCSSDIFITLRCVVFPKPLAQLTNTFYLRIYAITSRNKILAAYFGLLALGRLALLLVMTLAIPLVASDPNALPPNVFTRCGLVKYFRLQAIPAYIGTAFGKRSHIAPVGRRRSREALV